MLAIRRSTLILVFFLLASIAAPAYALTYNTHIASGELGGGHSDVDYITWGNSTRESITHTPDLNYDFNYTAREGDMITVDMYMTAGDQLNYSYTLSNGDTITGYIDDVNMDTLTSWYSNIYLNMNGLTDVYQQGDVIPFIIHPTDKVSLAYLFSHATNQTMVGLTVTHGPGIDLPDHRTGITGFKAHSNQTMRYSVEEYPINYYTSNLTALY